jgi:hypothetical protein
MFNQIRQIAPGTVNMARIICLAAMVPAILIFLALVALILWSSFRGFDITDESFYVLNMWQPLRNYGAVSEFGKILSIIPLVFGRDIAEIRIASFSVVLLFGLFSSLNITRMQGLNGLSLSLKEIVTTTCAACVAIIAYYKYWLLTPSYNLFILLGTLLVGFAILGALSRLRQTLDWRVALRIGVLMGIGGVLTAIGRPTGALAAGGVAGIWLIILLRFGNALVVGATSIATVLIFVTVHVSIFDGDWQAFAQRITFARDLATSLDAGHSIMSAVGRSGQELLATSKRLLAGPYLWGLITTAITYWIQSSVRYRDFTTPREKLSVATAAGSIAVVIGSMITANNNWESYLGFLGLDLAAFLITLLLVSGSLASRLAKFNYIEVANLRASYLTVGLYCLPFVMLSLTSSFGSNANIVAASGITFVLYASAILIAWSTLIFGEFASIRMAMHSLLCIAVGFGLLHAAHNPYRLSDGLLGQTQAISLMDSDTVLRVDEVTANWANTLKRIAVEHEWVVGTPLIDMTGGTPGAALVLGAHAPTTPWLVGGYSGSGNYATMALSAADHRLLRDAWILTAPDGNRRLDESILRTVGVEFPENYVLLGELRSGHRDEAQFVWKPKVELLEQ